MSIHAQIIDSVYENRWNLCQLYLLPICEGLEKQFLICSKWIWDNRGLARWVNQ